MNSFLFIDITIYYHYINDMWLTKSKFEVERKRTDMELMNVCRCNVILFDRLSCKQNGGNSIWLIKKTLKNFHCILISSKFWNIIGYLREKYKHRQTDSFSLTFLYLHDARHVMEKNLSHLKHNINDVIWNMGGFEGSCFDLVQLQEAY